MCVTQGFVRAAGCARGFFACRRGSVAISIGVSISVLIGMVGLGTEITFVMYKQRQMQAAADSAAHGAATALSKGYPANYALEGKAIAATGGFVDGAGGVVVTVNKPPASGNHTANADAVEVIVSQPQTLQLVSLFTPAAFNVGARAVATKGTTGGNSCVLTTDTSVATGIDLNNGARVTLDSCGVTANGTGSSALAVSGGARLVTDSVSVGGGVSVNNGGQITSTEPIEENQPAVADPYAAINPPASPGCSRGNGLNIGWGPGTQQLNPGPYCNGLSIGNGATVHFNPGVYYIKSGTLTFGGGTKITGTGVTFVLTRHNSNYATVNIGNGTDVTFSAPTSGLTSGIVFFGDRNAPTNNSNTFGGGAKMELTGAVYFPTQQVVYDNGSDNGSSCMQLIAWRVRFQGGSKFNNDCDSAGTTPIGGVGTATTLVE
jgi:hypothetical protein